MASLQSCAAAAPPSARSPLNIASLNNNLTTTQSIQSSGRVKPFGPIKSVLRPSSYSKPRISKTVPSFQQPTYHPLLTEAVWKHLGSKRRFVTFIRAQNAQGGRPFMPTFAKAFNLKFGATVTQRSYQKDPAGIPPTHSMATSTSTLPLKDDASISTEQILTRRVNRAGIPSGPSGRS